MSDIQEFQHHPVLDVPLQLIAEAAIGTSSLDEICARYNYSPEQTEQLRNDPGFKVRVSRAEQELAKEGVTTKMRARHVVDDMISEVWIQGKDPSVGLGMKLEIIKTLTKIADLEPKANQLVQQGSGFSLVINLPQIGDQPGRTIEAKATNVPDLGTDIPDLGTALNRVDAGSVTLEAASDKAPLETVNRVVNSTMNSALELPEDWDE